MKPNEICKFCGSTQTTPHSAWYENLAVPNRMFRIFECRTCKHHFQVGYPKETILNSNEVGFHYRKTSKNETVAVWDFKGKEYEIDMTAIRSIAYTPAQVLEQIIFWMRMLNDPD